MGWRSILLTALAGLATSSIPAADIVWIEAERCENCGGWVNDAQFIDQMGSPYLLAAGMGEPVADAVTHVRLPRSGRWRLWVRDRDWIPQYHPGRFQVIVNGRAADPEFGASGRPGWIWEDGGLHELGGRVEIRLHDLTGYYGRCDVLVLASDTRWTPPANRAALAALRTEQGGISRHIDDQGPYDVVVVGGGLAGCTAAVAAARQGAHVALVQNRPLLGGNASTEILVPPVGVWPSAARRDPLDPRETGLIEEFRTAGDQKIREGVLYSDRLMRWVKLEPNLDLHLNTHATGVEMCPGSPRRIAAVLAVDVRTGQRRRFPGRIFIDSSGDAVIGVAAGAEYRQGREPRSMYDEPWAPETANAHTMGNGLKYFHHDTGKPQPFVAPPWAYKFPTCDGFSPGRHPRFIRDLETIGHQWMVELGGMRDTYADAEEIRDDLWRLIFGLWDHTKNHCLADKDRAATHKLAWVGYVAGKRENRRLIGDYVLTQNDIGAQTLFADRVAYGGWTVDDHYSDGFFHSGSTGNNYDDVAHAYSGRQFSIPFRSLYSKNVDNLMMAGRDISATHLALSDTRVMLTNAVIGQAAGTGAALCVEHQTTPRRVAEEHREQLQQQLLKDGAYLIDLANCDPRDLARRARITASSEAVRAGKKMAAANVVNGYARAERGNPHAWAPDGSQQGPLWLELCWPESQSFNVVHLVFQTAALAPKRFAVEIWRDGQWKSVAEVGQNRHRRHVLGFARQTASRLRIVLDEPPVGQPRPNEPGGICEVRVYDEPQRLVEIAQRAERNMRLPDAPPQLPFPTNPKPQ
jgi:hypothetical protein